MTPQIPRPRSPVGFQSTAAPCKQSPSLIMKERHHFGNFYLLLSLLLLSVHFVSSEQSEHPDSARDMSYEKKKVPWDFNLPWDICLQTSACLCNLASCTSKLLQKHFDEPWDKLSSGSGAVPVPRARGRDGKGGWLWQMQGSGSDLPIISEKDVR